MVNIKLFKIKTNDVNVGGCAERNKFVRLKHTYVWCLHVHILVY